LDIARLNADFAVPGVLRFAAGRGGLAMIEVDNGLARALVSLHGAQVLGYRPAVATEDLLFVSERAWFEPGKEIKGGVPICWPWFGVDPERRGRNIHGFARMRPWSVVATESLPDGATCIRLASREDVETRALWPYPFGLRVCITLGATLTVALTTENPGDQPFTITQGLHSYFGVGDATRVRVLGLEGCTYIDKAAGANDAVVVQDGPVTVAAEVNRIYRSVPPLLTIEDPVFERRIHLTSRHSATAVVWNPWVETARAMADLDDEDYRRMLCVETVNTASEVIQVPPGGKAGIAAEYAIEAL
jgi:glucose-6-phosphate 1-epimerase